ncbi:MAG: SH3 domain-containing protein [Lentisphaeraceae bacterium]|nr:SH3 domain-containing protein [Lentisphaeraceae bacterium]
MRLLLLLLILSFSLSAEDIRLGTVTANALRMRARPGSNFEVLGQLKKGNKVKALETKNGWLKIVAPAGLVGWLPKKYINEDGTVIGDNINLRAGANIANSSFGKVYKGNKLNVLGYKKLWAKIEAPNSAHVWVGAAFIKIEPSIVPRDDEKNKELNKVIAVVDKEAPNAAQLTKLAEQKEAEQVLLAQQALEKKEKLAELAKQELEAFKKVQEEKKKLIVLAQQELAALQAANKEKLLQLQLIEAKRKQAELQRLAEEQKLALLSQLIETEKKKHSQKLLVSLAADGSTKLGNQTATFEELKNAFQSAGPATLVFIIAEENTNKATRDKITEAFKQIGATLYFEDPAKLMDTAIISNSYDKQTLSLIIKGEQEILLGSVQIPRQHLQSVILSYYKNFGKKPLYIFPRENIDPQFIDTLIKELNEADIETRQNDNDKKTPPIEVVKEEIIEVPKALPPGRVRMSGYVLKVRQSDRQHVDFALAVKVNNEFYSIAYLKGRAKDLEKYYLKELEIIGVQKRLEGWSRPILYVEEFSPVNK